MASKKLIYPAAERNKEPILGVLRKFIRPAAGQKFLEISSGSGQHVAHFAPNFPQVSFQPSECAEQLLQSIGLHTSAMANVRKPLLIDILSDCRTWPGEFNHHDWDYIYNANLIHIAPFACAVGLFKNVAKLLKDDGILFTYGPYAVDGKITPESNVRFDESLRSQNPEWGLRDLSDLKELANDNGIKLVDLIDMPANNKILIWMRK